MVRQLLLIAVCGVACVLWCIHLDIDVTPKVQQKVPVVRSYPFICHHTIFSFHTLHVLEVRRCWFSASVKRVDVI